MSRTRYTDTRSCTYRWHGVIILLFEWLAPSSYPYHKFSLVSCLPSPNFSHWLLFIDRCSPTRCRLEPNALQSSLDTETISSFFFYFLLIVESIDARANAKKEDTRGIAGKLWNNPRCFRRDRVFIRWKSCLTAERNKKDLGGAKSTKRHLSAVEFSLKGAAKK